jgi:hypothetical protein
MSIYEYVSVDYLCPERRSVFRLAFFVQEQLYGTIDKVAKFANASRILHTMVYRTGRLPTVATVYTGATGRYGFVEGD